MEPYGLISQSSSSTSLLLLLLLSSAAGALHLRPSPHVGVAPRTPQSAAPSPELTTPFPRAGDSAVALPLSLSLYVRPHAKAVVRDEPGSYGREQRRAATPLRPSPPLPCHGAAGGLDRGGRWQQATAPSRQEGRGRTRAVPFPPPDPAGGEAAAARRRPSGGGALPSVGSSGRGAGGGPAYLRRRHPPLRSSWLLWRFVLVFGSTCQTDLPCGGNSSSSTTMKWRRSFKSSPVGLLLLV